MENKCFACEKVVQEDNVLKGKWICSNQRCVRFGLLSRIFLTDTPEQVVPESTAGDVPVGSETAEDVKQEPQENDTIEP